MRTVRGAFTGEVLTKKLTLRAVGGTVTLSGTEATVRLSLESEIRAPENGAGSPRVTVTTAVSPPWTPAAPSGSVRHAPGGGDAAAPACTPVRAAGVRAIP